MNRSIMKAMAVLALATLPLTGVIAADKKSKAPKAGAATDTMGTYAVDAAKSQVKWLAKKVTGQHNGSVPVKSGELRVSNGQLTGGTVVIDVANLAVEDLQGDLKGKLTGHLKSDDFFGVEKYPTALFEITSVTKADQPTADMTHNVTGNLTIKGKTNPLTFPAKIVVTPTAINAEAKNVTIDRTLYDIRYGSGKFFQGLGDKVIYDNFSLDISLIATK